LVCAAGSGAVDLVVVCAEDLGAAVLVDLVVSEDPAWVVSEDLV
jgi:hypothetical protein